MIIFFSEEDLVSFGEYMISDERRVLYANRSGLDPMDTEPLEAKLKRVNELDMSSWAYLRSKQVHPDAEQG